MSTICSTECVRCEYCTLDETNKAVIKIYCSDKDKKFYYGQMLDCENFKKKNE